MYPLGGISSRPVWLFTCHCAYSSSPGMLSLSCSRMDSSHERRSRRSRRQSHSPSHRREADRRRSSSRHAAPHKPSRSSSHRQPESRWTRSQERSTGGAASPAHSDDAYMPFDKVKHMLHGSCEPHATVQHTCALQIEFSEQVVFCSHVVNSITFTTLWSLQSPGWLLGFRSGGNTCMHIRVQSKNCNLIFWRFPLSQFRLFVSD